MVASWGELAVWEIPAGSRLLTLQGQPNDDIQTCAWSPDGLRIVSSSNHWMNRNALILWNADRGDIQRALLGHSQKIIACAFSPDGSRLVSGSGEFLRNNELIVWDVASGMEVARHTVESREVCSCSFLPGSRIAFIEARVGEGALVVMDTGLQEEQCRIPMSMPKCLAVSPDGGDIVVGSLDHSVYVVDAVGGRLQSEMPGHGDWVESCDFSPSGDAFVTGSRDLTARIWPRPRPEKSDLERENMHSLAVRSGAFSGDGRLFVSGSESEEHDRPVGSVRLWDARTGEAKGILLDQANDVLKCAFLGDNRRVLASTDAGYFEIPGFRLLDTMKGGSLIITQSPTAKWDLDARSGLLCTLNDGKGEIVEVNTWNIEHTFAGAGDCVLDADQRIVVTGSPEHRVTTIDLTTHESRIIGPRLRDEIRMLVMSPDKQCVVALSAGHVGKFPALRIEGEVACLEMGTDRPRLHLAERDYRSVCYCGSHLVISADKDLLTFDAASGAQTGTLVGHSYTIVGCAGVGDTSRVVSISLDMTVRLWDVQTSELLGVFFLRGRGTFLAMSPDGSTIAAGDELGYVYLVKVESVDSGQKMSAMPRESRRR